MVLAARDHPERLMKILTVDFFSWFHWLDLISGFHRNKRRSNDASVVGARLFQALHGTSSEPRYRSGQCVCLRRHTPSVAILAMLNLKNPSAQRRSRRHTPGTVEGVSEDRFQLLSFTPVHVCFLTSMASVRRSVVRGKKSKSTPLMDASRLLELENSVSTGSA